MSTIDVRIGVPQIFLTVDNDDVIPSLSSLSFTACADTPTELLINDSNQPLLSTDTYQVMIGLVGRHPNGGYAVAECSLSSGNLTVTSGQTIQVKVANGAWPALFDSAICAAIFLKINAAKFQLAGFAYIDPTADFIHTIAAKPLRVSPRFDYSVLTDDTQDDPILGDPRDALLGVSLEEITPTTGEFNFRRPVTNVTVSPNNASDFQVATTRSSGITFQALGNSIKNFVRAAAGIYVKTLDGTDIIEESQMSLNTAQAILRGNRAVQVFIPPDSTGNQEVRLLVGLLTVNQTELTEAWSKSAPTPVTFQFDAASLDLLINNQHTEIGYVRKAT